MMVVCVAGRAGLWAAHSPLLILFSLLDLDPGIVHIGLVQSTKGHEQHTHALTGDRVALQLMLEQREPFVKLLEGLAGHAP